MRCLAEHTPAAFGGIGHQRNESRLSRLPEPQHSRRLVARGYDGTNGFAIGEDAHAESVEEQDRVDSANLYKVLTSEVIPLFYQRDAQGIPRQWIQRIRHAMATLVPQYTTSRMVREYVDKYYLPSRSPSDPLRRVEQRLILGKFFRAGGYSIPD
jgi:hypothetical protein